MAQAKKAKSGNLSKLANISLSQKELSKIDQQIKLIISHVDNIQKLDLEGLDTTNQVTGKTNELRKDKVSPSLTQEQALSQAKRTYNGYFVVPGVFNDK